MQARRIRKIGQGAEGIIYVAESYAAGPCALDSQENSKEKKNKAPAMTVVKKRVKKNYRIPEIDLTLRRSRTRREAKVLEKLREIGFDAPGLLFIDDKNMVVEMELVDGEKLRDVLHRNPAGLSREIGRKVAIMHNANIIHGDLTTSNMILGKDNIGKDNKVSFIDFGLSFFSDKFEDKAVDIHLARQALESRHYDIFDECFREFLDAYKKEARDSARIIKRLGLVEARGRNKERS